MYSSRLFNDMNPKNQETKEVTQICGDAIKDGISTCMHA